MPNELLFLILSVIFFGVSYSAGRDLEQGYYNKDVDPIYLDRYGIWRVTHSLFFPWAYFKPWKVKEAYPLLLLYVISFVLGTYLLGKWSGTF